MSYAAIFTEFPHFAGEALPPIPQGFHDHSWGQDTCPHLRHNLAESYGLYGPSAIWEWLCIYIEHSDPAMREFPETSRYALQIENSDTGIREVICESDNWNDILESLFAFDPKLWPLPQTQYAL